MSKINENIAKNISNLRKSLNWTQLDLAKKLNYSDKAISKWERGESIPDIEMLDNIAKLFKVNVNYLIEEHSDKQIKMDLQENQFFLRNLLITILSCVSVLIVATIIFIIATLYDVENAKTYWITFVMALPLCCIICAYYAYKNKYWLMRLLSVSLLLWTLIGTIFSLLMVFVPSTTVWLIFIIGIPIEGVICLYYFWKKTF